MGPPKVFSTFEYEIENSVEETFEIILNAIKQIYSGKKIKRKKDKWGMYCTAQTGGKNPIFFSVEVFKDGDGTYLRLKIGSFPQTDDLGDIVTQEYHADVLNRIIKISFNKIRIRDYKKIFTCPICGSRKKEESRFCTDCSDKYWAEAQDEKSEYIQSFLIENIYKTESKLAEKIDESLDTIVQLTEKKVEEPEEDEEVDIGLPSYGETPKTPMLEEIFHCPRCGAYVDEKYQLLYKKGYDIECDWCNFIIKRKYSK